MPAFGPIWQDVRGKYAFRNCYRLINPHLMSLLSRPSNLRENRRWFFVAIVFALKDPSQINCPQAADIKRAWQTRVPWMHGGSQTTSKTPSPSSWRSLKYCLNCSSFSSSLVIPASSAPDRLASKGGRWLSEIKWETKGDKANMSF